MNIGTDPLTVATAGKLPALTNKDWADFAKEAVESPGRPLTPTEQTAHDEAHE